MDCKQEDCRDLERCRTEVEMKILRMEGEIKVSIVKLDDKFQHINEMLETLVTKTEFAPYRAVTAGLAGGVLIAALGAVMAKVLGW